MNVLNACEIYCKKTGEKNISNIVETEKYFVFSSVPPGEMARDCALSAVNKIKGDVESYAVPAHLDDWSSRVKLEIPEQFRYENNRS